MLKSIGIEDVRLIAFGLARRKLAFDEPIPDFDTRFPNILESCLAVPFQEVFGHSNYPTLVSRASVLFYLLIKNHPFSNGNKRIALMSLLVLLSKNSKWLDAGVDELFDLTVWIAGSDAKEHRFVLMAIQTFIGEHLVNWPV